MISLFSLFLVFHLLNLSLKLHTKSPLWMNGGLPQPPDGCNFIKRKFKSFASQYFGCVYVAR